MWLCSDSIVNFDLHFADITWITRGEVRGVYISVTIYRLPPASLANTKEHLQAKRLSLDRKIASHAHTGFIDFRSPCTILRRCNLVCIHQIRNHHLSRIRRHIIICSAWSYLSAYWTDCWWRCWLPVGTRSLTWARCWHVLSLSRFDRKCERLRYTLLKICVNLPGKIFQCGSTAITSHYGDQGITLYKGVQLLLQWRNFLSLKV